MDAVTHDGHHYAIPYVEADIDEADLASILRALDSIPVTTNYDGSTHRISNHRIMNIRPNPYVRGRIETVEVSTIVGKYDGDSITLSRESNSWTVVGTGWWVY